MKKVTLLIETLGETKTVTLEDETSFGRTDAADIALGDVGLSRKNTTFFRDGDIVFVVDENSLNGTFVNGEKVSDQPQRIFDGDQIKLGTETYIRLEIVESRESRVESRDNRSQSTDNRQQKTDGGTNPQSAITNPKSNKPPFVVIAAVSSTFLIILIAAAGIFIASRYEGKGGISKGKPTAKIVASATVPIRVVDPLGGEEPETLDDLIEAWEAKEAELDIKTVEAVTSTTNASPNALKLDVTIDYIKQQIAKANEKRNAPTGLVSVNVPAELSGGRGIGKQIDKIRELGFNVGNLPHDFGDLAKKRMQNDLMELPAATQNFYLDVGGSADDSPFMQFDPNTRGKTPYAPGMEGYNNLATLAANYDGQKYDLNNPGNRRQMKIRLLRMFHPSALKILNELGNAYFQKFGRPLKVTSLTRSLEYQFELTKSNSNAFKGATPPHTTGCTFDLAYLHMTAEEQNFVMAKLAEFESRGSSDSLREVGAAPCIHTFVYPDGKPPKSAVASLISLDFGLYDLDFLKLNDSVSQFMMTNY